MNPVVDTSKDTECRNQVITCVVSETGAKRTQFPEEPTVSNREARARDRRMSQGDMEQRSD